LEHLVFAGTTLSLPLLGLRAAHRMTIRACAFVDNAVTSPPGGRLLELAATGPVDVLFEDCWLLGNHVSQPGNALIGFAAVPPAGFEAVILRRVALVANDAPVLFAGPGITPTFTDCQITESAAPEVVAALASEARRGRAPDPARLAAALR
jgi:hypothetical protein